MEIGILNILDKKDISAERIVLQVREDCNSWAFILFCNTSKDEGCRKSFIFPNMEIHKGVHIPADTRSAFPVISVQSPVSIQCCWQS